MSTMEWRDYLLSDISDRLQHANAARLERQAERLIARGYRVEELENTVRTEDMLRPTQLAGNVLTIPVWGNIQPKPGGPGAVRLALRRAWRRVRPYRPATTAAAGGVRR